MVFVNIVGVLIILVAVKLYIPLRTPPSLSVTVLFLSNFPVVSP